MLCLSPEIKALWRQLRKWTSDHNWEFLIIPKLQKLTKTKFNLLLNLELNFEKTRIYTASVPHLPTPPTNQLLLCCYIEGAELSSVSLLRPISLPSCHLVQAKYSNSWSTKKPKSLFGDAPPLKMFLLMYWNILIKKIFILRPPTMGPSMGPICTLLPLTVPYYIF